MRLAKVTTAVAFVVAAGGLATADTAQVKTGPTSPDAPATTPAVDLVAAVANGQAPPLFVGRGGEVYSPAEPNSWRRSHLGGVATDLRGAALIDGALIGAGDRTPLYRLADGLWSAEPVFARGEVVLGDGKVPVLAIENRAYIHNGRRWAKRFRADANITAVWAASERRIYFATSTGLFRAKGRNTSAIACKSDCTTVADLAGVAGRDLYAITSDGRLLYIAVSSAREVELTGELAGFVPTVARGVGRRVLFAGVAADAEARHGMLVAGHRDKLTPVADLGPLADGDQPVAIIGTGDVIIVATRRGQVLSISGAEIVAKGQVSDAPPAPPARDPGKAPAAAR